MSAPNWSDIQNAVVSWLKTGSGLTRVIWGDQDGPKPAKDFIRVKLLTLVPVGQDEMAEETTPLDVNGEPIDATRAPDLTPGDEVPGTEIKMIARGQRELTFSVQAHTARAITSPVSTLSKVQTALRLESVRTALLAVGLAPFDIGTVRDITALVDDKYEGRAVVECRFYMTEEVSDFTTYIAEAPVEMFTGPPDSGTRDDIDI